MRRGNLPITWSTCEYRWNHEILGSARSAPRVVPMKLFAMFLRLGAASSVNRMHVDVSSYVAEQASVERSQSKSNGALRRYDGFGIPSLTFGSFVKQLDRRQTHRQLPGRVPFSEVGISPLQCHFE